MGGVEAPTDTTLTFPEEKSWRRGVVIFIGGEEG